MNHLAQLIDRRRSAAAIVAGLDVEIAMALGDRDGARKAMKEMNAQEVARQAMKEACFFDRQGEQDSQAMRS